MTLDVDGNMVFNITQHCFEENCNKDTNRTALIVVDENDKAHHYSYHKIYESIHQCANFLSKKGLKKGDRILLRSEAGLQFVVLYFSAVAIGLVPIASLALLTRQEVNYIIEDAGIALIYQSDLTELNIPLIRKTPLLLPIRQARVAGRKAWFMRIELY